MAFIGDSRPSSKENLTIAMTHQASPTACPVSRYDRQRSLKMANCRKPNATTPTHPV